MGPDVLDQQVSCLWQNNHLLSVSLSGFINYLDVNNSKTPLRVVKGHNRTITSLAVNTSSQDKEIYSGSCDGNITHWNPSNGDHDRIVGKSHSNQVSDLAFSSKGKIYSVGFDDICRTITCSNNEFDTTNEFKLDQQPHGIAVTPDGEIVIVAEHFQIQVRRAHDGGIISSVAAMYEPSSISINSSNQDVAVGGAKDSKVHVYSFDGQKLIEKDVSLVHREAVTDVCYSPDGKYLAAGDQNRKVILYSSENYELAHQLEWGYHTARVNCLAWSPDSVHLASGSLDTAIIVWDAANPSKHFKLNSKHNLKLLFFFLVFLFFFVFFLFL